MRHDLETLPIYERIKRQIREQIDSGEYQPGDRVPSEQELAQAHDVSRGQTRQALRDLEMEGYLVRSRGRGSFVAPRVRRDRIPSPSRLRTVTVALPQSPVYYNQNVVRGFLVRATEQKLHATFYYLNLVDPVPELDFLRQIRDSGSQGLALWPCFRSQEECDLVAELYRAGFPCVLLDRYLSGVAADSVVTDNVRAYRMLVERLVANGHRRIAYVTRHVGDSVMEDRFSGYLAGVTHAQLPFAGAELGPELGQDPADRAYRLAQELASTKPPFTAICCAEDWSAMYMHSHLARQGVRVPDDVAIATMWDNDPAVTRFDRPFITVVQDGYAIGRQAADLLEARIADPGKPIERRFIPVSPGARMGSDG